MGRFNRKIRKVRRTYSLTKMRLFVYGTTLLLVSSSIVLLALYNHDTTKSIAEQNDSLARTLAKLDEEQKRIEERKAAEAEERRLAAAADAAEQARTANGGTANVIDSTACFASSSRSDPTYTDVIVNKKHCLQPLTYAPNDLVTSNGATLSAKIINQFNQLYSAAAAAGQPFSVTSSYRSYETQVSTYAYWVSVSGQVGADTYSARPGYSEHQTGYAFDVAAGGCTLDCFGSTSQYQWMQQNAAEYGFIQRYYAGFEDITGYKAEEWHYRYVGVEIAKDMQARGIKTLEQYWGMSGGGY